MILEAIGCISKRNSSGYDFFGFYRKEVMDILSERVKLTSNFDGPLKDIANIRHRNAGPTENLSSKQAIRSRNKLNY